MGTQSVCLQRCYREVWRGGLCPAAVLDLSPGGLAGLCYSLTVPAGPLLARPV